MPISQAKVKSVLSGDTLILTSVNNPSQERQLSLAYVSAPRLRKDGEEVYFPTATTLLDSPKIHLSQLRAHAIANGRVRTAICV
jgi:hypothetical protein